MKNNYLTQPTIRIELPWERGIFIDFKVKLKIIREQRESKNKHPGIIQNHKKMPVPQKRGEVCH